MNSLLSSHRRQPSGRVASKFLSPTLKKVLRYKSPLNTGLLLESIFCRHSSNPKADIDKNELRPACARVDRGTLVSKKSSKRGLTRRPLFLVRVDSLVCSVEMIGPSHSAGAGRDALPRVRRRASIGREQAKRAATASRRATPVARERNPTTSLAQERVPHARRRIARERVPNSRNGIGSGGTNHSNRIELYCGEGRRSAKVNR